MQVCWESVYREVWSGGKHFSRAMASNGGSGKRIACFALDSLRKGRD